jgi:hypothetical protein
MEPNLRHRVHGKQRFLLLDDLFIANHDGDGKETIVITAVTGIVGESCGAMPPAQIGLMHTCLLVEKTAALVVISDRLIRECGGDETHTRGNG